VSYANRYASTQAETASRERLMLLLFETALRHMRAAAAALEQGRAAEAHAGIARSGDIVALLHASLDHSRSPELCDRLGEVYRFVCQRLLDANVERDPRAIREAERAFAPVAEGFAGAVAALGGSLP
jgi:flagellar protein FliS